jgi:hypothetical protein
MRPANRLVEVVKVRTTTCCSGCVCWYMQSVGMEDLCAVFAYPPKSTNAMGEQVWRADRMVWCVSTERFMMRMFGWVGRAGSVAAGVRG